MFRDQKLHKKKENQKLQDRCKELANLIKQKKKDIVLVRTKVTALELKKLESNTSLNKIQSLQNSKQDFNNEE